MHLSDKSIGIVILAAGASSRFGSPKQLLKFEGQTLIERIAETALSTGLETVVVLGANSNEINKVVGDLEIKIVVNRDWESGMSSSIKAGLTHLLDSIPDLSAVILLLCDQPFIKKETILKLKKAHADGGSLIVASKYSDAIGIPALFTQPVFRKLFDLTGDIGAKPLIEEYLETGVTLVRAPEASKDIDTKEDLN